MMPAEYFAVAAKVQKTEEAEQRMKEREPEVAERPTVYADCVDASPKCKVNGGICFATPLS